MQTKHRRARAREEIRENVLDYILLIRCGGRACIRGRIQ